MYRALCWEYNYKLEEEKGKKRKRSRRRRRVQGVWEEFVDDVLKEEVLLAKEFKIFSSNSLELEQGTGFLFMIVDYHHPSCH